MSFTDFNFWAIFMPLVFLFYWLFRKNNLIQNIILLGASFIFYGIISWNYLIVLSIVILVTYVGSLYGYYIAKKSIKNAKRIYLVTIVLNIAILLIFKYTKFLIFNINRVVYHTIPIPNLILPVGLSFYVFQSLSYLFEMYSNNEKPEENIISYALFVSFFPTIVSGPIQRSLSLLPQIKNRKRLSYHNFKRAFLIFLWGAFLKMIIADRLAILTNTVYDNYLQYSGIIIIIGACAYSIQIYADFSGYSYMAMACCLFLGYQIKENFHQPYLATSIRDFWRRWHISLTTWLTDYIYIPLGGNKKGTINKYINIVFVFLISGIWHGASWNFIVWGTIHAIYQVVGQITIKIRKKITNSIGLDRKTTGYLLWQRLCIFSLTTFAWIFFRTTSLHDAVYYIQRVFIEWNPWVITDDTLINLGLSSANWHVLFIALLIWGYVSLMRENGKNVDYIINLNLPSRWLCYILLFLSNLIFGVYGPEFISSSFIYAGF